MKFFNTEGPVNQPMHYKLDPLYRWDLEEITDLINKNKYFILHAPRQTGKTSCLLALRDKLNKEGEYFSVYTNFEIGQAFREDIHGAMMAIVGGLAINIDDLHDSTLNIRQFFNEMKINFNPGTAIKEFLSYLCKKVNKPVVLMIDEIDALVGDTLISVFRQLREGYNNRPNYFPASVVLCGLRDIKDYRIHLGKDIITGGSPFNIIAKSLRLGNFTREDVVELYGQLKEDTGQYFTEDCFDLVMEYTDGQPWLVNALARDVVEKLKKDKKQLSTVNCQLSTEIITPDMIEYSKEHLILRKETHLGQLTDKLKEARVYNVILPMILGGELKPNEDDAQYCIDLGLVKKVNGSLEIANKIYKEVIPRTLTEDTQLSVPKKYSPVWIKDDDTIDTYELLRQFKEFWNENTSIWASSIAGYQEAAPHLVLQAFLQRMINSGGYINREYALGSRRTDLFIKRMYTKNGVNYTDKIVIEVKIIGKKQKYENVRETAIEQTAKYAKYIGVKEAQIIIFDRDQSQDWVADEPNEHAEYDGVKMVIWKLRSGEE
ncbi:MAG: AAA-like domain-containing protein [Candidatus Cloacimonetes bacterium]|nr:AAA-like domain-containing protein [Candidatus Cloacimonadota bacterium]